MIRRVEHPELAGTKDEFWTPGPGQGFAHRRCRDRLIGACLDEAPRRVPMDLGEGSRHPKQSLQSGYDAWILFPRSGGQTGHHSQGSISVTLGGLCRAGGTTLARRHGRGSAEHHGLPPNFWRKRSVALGRGLSMHSRRTARRSPRRNAKAVVAWPLIADSGTPVELRGASSTASDPWYASDDRPRCRPARSVGGPLVRDRTCRHLRQCTARLASIRWAASSLPARWRRSDYELLHAFSYQTYERKASCSARSRRQPVATSPTMVWKNSLPNNVVILRNALEDESGGARSRCWNISSRYLAPEGRVPRPASPPRAASRVSPLSAIELKRRLVQPAQAPRACNPGPRRPNAAAASATPVVPRHPGDRHGKTLLTTEFLSSGVNSNERCLLLAFEECCEQLFRNADWLGRQLRGDGSGGQTKVYCVYPETAESGRSSDHHQAISLPNSASPGQWWTASPPLSVAPSVASASSSSA